VQIPLAVTPDASEMMHGRVGVGNGGGGKLGGPFGSTVHVIVMSATISPDAVSVAVIVSVC